MDQSKTTRLPSAWEELIHPHRPIVRRSFNLDFHSVLYYREHPLVERQFVSARSRSQPSILVFLAQDAGTHVLCYSNVDLRKGEQAEEVFQFVAFWKRAPPNAPALGF
jgi:hypothetical protein